MTPERWQRVKQVFDSALQYEPARRSAFLSDACGGDDDLRQEVESLIASHEKTGAFIDAPAYEAAAELIVNNKAQMKPGQTLGAFEIISFISRGGMGEVYLAQDRRLSRKVALKILPVSFTKDRDRLRRFEQEARAASALNHPNIITIYEILQANSTHVIATEFVEGQTLRQRLSHAPLNLNESLQIAIQVADALAAAHQVGIIHRDVKPENVMLRPDGYVKVLDFGLAKLAEHSPSITPQEALTKQVRTGSGVVIGTAGYMSPEQARGKEVDARSDIFSLGAVIYEMVTQRKPFDGETPSDVLAAILKTEPAPVSQFAADVPVELIRIVAKALRKDREERYQVVKDLLLDLKSLKQDLEFQQRLNQTSTPGAHELSLPNLSGQAVTHAGMRTDEVVGATATSTSISKSALSSMVKARRWPTFALIALILLGGSFGLYKLFTRSRSAAGKEAATVENIARVTVWSGLDTQPALSPDGNSVAYSSDRNGPFEIYIKQLTPGGREIQLTTDGKENFQPAWSPDGQRIAYYSKTRGGIWVVPTLGGAPRQLTDFGASPKWSHDNSTIVFQSDSNPDLGAGSVGSSTIWTVPAQGGAPKQITQVGDPVGGHVGPVWSPDGRRIAFVALNFSNQEIWSVAVSGSDLKQMTHLAPAGKAGYPIYTPNGRGLYFTTGPVMWYLPLSENGEPAGDLTKMTDVGASGIAGLTLSADGKKMAYAVQLLTSNIWSVPVSLMTNTATGPPRALTNQTATRNNQPIFSPDGKKIAFMEYLRGAGADIWVADADGKNPAQITSSPRNIVPSWFPDGDQLAYVSKHDERRSIWATSIQNRREHPLFDIGRDIEYARLSPDGKQLAFNLADKGVINIWTAPISGGQPKQLTFDKELAGFPTWSPDGKFIAYQLKRGDDAYLMLIPSDGGESIQLTFDHGRSWPYGFSPDGDKIVFAGERGGVWNVWWYSRSTKQLKQITGYTSLNTYVRYPSWSPLGNQIAYEYAETTGNIWMLELK
jgi:eukaryotic-like serine/threonine-protein kinase